MKGYRPKKFKVTKTYIDECLRDIRKATKKVQEANNKDGTNLGGFHQSQQFQDLLCRVGNLEVTLNYLWDVHKKGMKAEVKPNRLCTHSRSY